MDKSIRSHDLQNARDGAGRQVMVVEDDVKIASLLADYLADAGYQPRILADGRQVAPAVRQAEPAAILLDLMLPGLGGHDVCREVRQFSAAPILMLTARVDEADQLAGLDGGADDYICKPFRPREVIARVHAAIRRAEGQLVVEARPYQIDDEGWRILWRGVCLGLTPHEFRLLKPMMSRPGRVFTRADLLDRISADFRDVTDRAIDSHIKNIRRKLSSAAPEIDPIVSVYGVGYRFDPVT